MELFKWVCLEWVMGLDEGGPNINSDACQIIEFLLKFCSRGHKVNWATALEVGSSNLEFILIYMDDSEPQLSSAATPSLSLVMEIHLQRIKSVLLSTETVCISIGQELQLE